MTGLRLAAPAKLNLYLHVTGKRADGYHLLDSLAVFTEIGDLLTAAPADALSLTLDGPAAAGLAGEDDNLVLRAARLLAEQGGVRPQAALSLTKTLPVASGIGGGSADAAAALRLLAALWNLRPAAEDLAALALRLGADVPVCLSGTPAFMGGIGEQLTPAPPLPPVALLLVNPNQPLSTIEVFRARTGGYSKPGRFGEAPPDAAALAALLRERGNDLMAPARRLAPVIGTILADLEAQADCLLARMSGSGATCFALFADSAAAGRGARALAARHPEWWVAATALRAEAPRIVATQTCQ